MCKVSFRQSCVEHSVAVVKVQELTDISSSGTERRDQGDARPSDIYLCPQVLTAPQSPQSRGC